ncbi:hypothetical protein PSI9734_02330 [Pseudidiomarina piscicola]|uniref:DUF4097 domain-containing protein n=1 Tax=Pseudidiomarina piscicola TaxID=2614830 RepID=A0A6S6WPA1_9GAMM|nr:DUF4097 family beta strand repeat-containing protein [Pseudidiomarina piscicola]CAB0151976.1 hypothetical protein PSI9734_02330 [Pseudidiomarina piscicola]VZT41414.1 hypothetical protein PSI9734_02330 [Pseudomonas aeruginosa]
MNHAYKQILAMVLLLAIGLLAPQAIAKQQSVEQRMEVPTTIIVSLENMRGEVEIVGTDDNLAKVSGRLDEYATGLTFERDGNNLTIRVDMPKRGNFSGQQGSALRVELPRRAELHVTGVSSDFTVYNFSSQVRVNTVSGDIRAESLEGQLRLSTVSGDVQSRKLAGVIALKSVSGDVVDHASTASSASYTSTSGDVEVSTQAQEVTAESVSGDVEMELGAVMSLQIKSVSGDVSAQLQLLEQGRIEANSVSGNVELAFVGALDATLSADVSGGGTIINKLNDAQARESEWGVGANLETKLGNGAGHIELSTMSGDIIVANK